MRNPRAIENLPKPKPFEERFWQKVDKTGECWLWTGGQFSNKYGRVAIAQSGEKYSYKNGLAHRVAWAFQAGETPRGTLILHICDTPSCVRNDEVGWYEVNGVLHKRWGHLFEGTTQDNIADKVEKGRQGAARGMASGMARFTDDDIREIRRLNQGGMGKRKIAKLYQAAENTIHCIVRYKTWKEVL